MGVQGDSYRLYVTWLATSFVSKLGAVEGLRYLGITPADGRLLFVDVFFFDDLLLIVVPKNTERYCQ